MPEIFGRRTLLAAFGFGAAAATGFLAWEFSQPDKQLPSPQLNEVRIQAEVQESLRRADKLVPIMKKVCDIVGQPITVPDLLCLCLAESSMNAKRNVQTVAGSGKQTALGIVQITEETFLRYLHRYARSLKSEIKEESGVLAQGALDTFERWKDGAGYDEFRQGRIAAYIKAHLGKKPTKTKIAKVTADAEKAVSVDYSPQWITQVGRGRESDYLSLLLAAKDLNEHYTLLYQQFRIWETINPNLLFRLPHMFGIAGAQRLFATYVADPTATMVAALGLNGVPKILYDKDGKPRHDKDGKEIPNSQWDKLKNNLVVETMPVGQYLRDRSREYAIRRQAFDEYYQTRWAQFQDAQPSSPGPLRRASFDRRHPA